MVKTIDTTKAKQKEKYEQSHGKSAKKPLKTVIKQEKKTLIRRELWMYSKKNMKMHKIKL